MERAAVFCVCARPIRLTHLHFRLKWGMIETKDGYHETKEPPEEGGDTA